MWNYLCPVPLECLGGGKINIQISSRTSEPWRCDQPISAHTRYPRTSQASEQPTPSPWLYPEWAGLQQSCIFSKYLSYCWRRVGPRADKLPQQNTSTYQKVEGKDSNHSANKNIIYQGLHLRPLNL